MNREILAIGVTDETVIGQYATQIGVTLEDDADHIECLALEPVGAGPEVNHRGDYRHIVIRAEGPHPQPMVAHHGKQMHDCRVMAALPSATRVSRVIDTAQIDHLVETQTRLVAQLPGGVMPRLRTHLDADFA